LVRLLKIDIVTAEVAYQCDRSQRRGETLRNLSTNVGAKRRQQRMQPAMLQGELIDDCRMAIAE
jgi:hypothetical protein